MDCVECVYLSSVGAVPLGCQEVNLMPSFTKPFGEIVNRELNTSQLGEIVRRHQENPHHDNPIQPAAVQTSPTGEDIRSAIER